MRMKRDFTIGIDLGGTKMLVALLDGAFRIAGRVKVKTRVELGRARFLDSLFNSVRSLCKDSGIPVKRIAALGIGSPGIIDRTKGTVVFSPNIPFLTKFRLAQALAGELDVKVSIENDVNAGLYGEFRFGAAKGYQNIIGIFMGTGIGGALILNGRLFRGSSGAAGEIGHVFVQEGPVCGCGRTGCLEASAGRLAVASEAAAIAARQGAPQLFAMTGPDVAQIKSNVLRKAVEAGDGAVEDLIRRKARLVGCVMGSLVNLLNPDLFVLGGGMVEAMPKLIVKEAESAMRERAMPGLVRHVRVAESKLKDDAIILGAAALARDESARGESDG